MTPDQLAAIHAAANRRERPWSVDEFRGLLQQTGIILTGSDHAFTLGRIVLDEAEVLTLATHPDHQRRGLARRALAAFEDQARVRGAVKTFLEVAEDNAPAKALYNVSGYVQVGRRPGYYAMSDGSLIAALVLQKPLTRI